ncbi:hypothetical protein ACHAXT_009501 [Thalassiosira profunda]
MASPAAAEDGAVGGGAPATAAAAGERDPAPSGANDASEEEGAHHVPSPSSAPAAAHGDGDAHRPSARPDAGAPGATRFRSGWGNAPKVPQFQSFVPPPGGETAAPKRWREARAAALREKEGEERKRAEEEAEKERLEQERMEENERLGREIEEKRGELERMREEGERGKAAAVAAVAPAAADEADAEDGAATAEEGAGDAIPLAPENVEEKGTDDPSPDPQKRRRKCLLCFIPLLLLVAVAVPLGVVFGKKSDEAAAVAGGVVAAGAGNDTDAPSLAPSGSSQMARPPRPAPPVDPGPTADPATNPTVASTGEPSMRPTLRPVTDSPTRRPTAVPVTAASTLTGGPATLTIEASDPSLTDGSGGAPNSLYSFILTANGIPSDVNEVRFEWTPGFGAGGSDVAPIATPGTAAATIELAYPNPGSYAITASVYDGQRELATDSLQISIAGTTLAIDPPGRTNAQLLVPYSFTLAAGGIPGTVDNVKFTWSFGVGPSGVGESASIPATGGSAAATATQTYTANGAFGLVVDVRDVSTNEVLAQNSVTVIVGEGREREDTLFSCGGWTAAQSGGGGVTIDNWDVSTIPDGAVFDIRFDAFSVPDKFVVEYPLQNVVLDTGWRGSASNEGNALYPGGIAGDGDEESNNIFAKLTQDTLRVTAIGPDPNTAWEYDLRCRTPSLKDGEPCTETSLDAVTHFDCPSAACAYESLSPASSMVCCSSGQTTVRVTSEEGWSWTGNRNFCNDQPIGTACGATDAICSTNACVGQMCRNSKLAANEVCSIDNDCEQGKCDYASFSPSSSNVCCASGASTRIYTSSSDGWPSGASRYFCTDQPLGTACGVTDSLCASDACVGGACSGAKLAANAACSASNDCSMGACGFSAFSPTASTVCCASGASTRIYTSSSDGWPSGASRYFCTDQPLGTACGVTDSLCMCGRGLQQC